MEILHFLSLKSAAYKQERLQIESGLWWRAYLQFKASEYLLRLLRATLVFNLLEMLKDTLGSL